MQQFMDLLSKTNQVYVELQMAAIKEKQLPVPIPDLIGIFKFTVTDEDGIIMPFKSMASAYKYFTGLKRNLPWRDAKRAFKQLDLKIERIHEEEKKETKNEEFPSTDRNKTE